MIGKTLHRLAMGGLFAAMTTTSALAQAPHDGTNATYWVQNSVEFKANSYALYQLAMLRLDQALADKSWTAVDEQGSGYEGKPPAVILDVDETVLDNSLYQAWIVENDKWYSSKTWGPFVNTVTSRAIAGSLEFTQYAASKGVTVFYVSNRKAPLEDATRKNLAKFGYPVDAKQDVVLLRNEKKDWGSKKSTRRAHVAATHRVLLLMGDNLGDFSDSYKGTPADRAAVYAKNQARWGKSWIMLANPTYGSWEGASFGFNWKMKSDKKRAMKYEIMTDWPGPKK